MLSTLSQVLRGYKEVMCLCMDTKHLRLPTLAFYRTWPLSFSRLKRYAGTQGVGAQDSHIRKDQKKRLHRPLWLE